MEILVLLLRVVPVLSLVALALAATAPGASAACPVEVGPAQTRVCATDFNHEWGDPTCEGPGYHYGSTFVTATAAGAAQAGVAGDRSCLNSGSDQREGQQVRANAAVWGVAALEVRYTDSDDHAGHWCRIEGQAYVVAAGSLHPSVGCISGLLPVLPWGDLLPDP